jgi:iron complex transport system ATP-binding protein
VHILGEQMGRVELARLRRHIGHVNPRHRLQYSLTVREVVSTGITATIDTPMRWTPSPEERDRADAMIAAVGLSHKADDVWPTLSQGERGRTLIARALIPGPRLLLLDEPTTGLDASVAAGVLDLIRDLLESTGVAAVVVSHDFAVIEMLTRRCLVMHHGRIVEEGLTDQLLEDPQHAYSQRLVGAARG